MYTCEHNSIVQYTIADSCIVCVFVQYTVDLCVCTVQGRCVRMYTVDVVGQV